MRQALLQHMKLDRIQADSAETDGWWPYTWYNVLIE
ncbi:hypothetical protein ACVWZ5_002737 [Pseudomonas sp. TE6283]